MLAKYTVLATVLGTAHMFAQTPIDVLLPAPTGPFHIGRTEHHWIDQSRSETLGTADGAKRELMVRVWYPAQSTALPRIPYLEHFDAVQDAVGENALRKALGRSYPLVASGQLRTHAVADAPIVEGTETFRVIVFSHGHGTPTLAYCIQIEELVSHGYAVAAIDHTYETAATVFPDGRVIPFDQKSLTTNLAMPGQNGRVDVWTADIRFVLDQLGRHNSDSLFHDPWSGRLDEAHIGAFGHSLGGRAIVGACQKDKRIKACLNEDGILSGGLPFTVNAVGRSMDQPFLLLMTAADMHRPSTTELARMNMTQQGFENMVKVLQSKRSQLFASIRGGSYRITINVPGISHMSFSDLPYLSAGEVEEKGNALRALEITRAYTLGFFDKYLRHFGNSLLDAKGTRYQEVTSERFPATDLEGPREQLSRQ